MTVRDLKHHYCFHSLTQFPFFSLLQIKSRGSSSQGSSQAQVKKNRLSILEDHRNKNTAMSIEENLTEKRIERRCQCELCSEDRRVEEFFKKKPFWWQQNNQQLNLKQLKLESQKIATMTKDQISIAKWLVQRCQCKLCSEDHRVEEFFKKKPFW